MTEKNTDRLSDLSTMREILSRHGFTFSKALGQNFLINPSVCPRMAEMCGADSESGALEIGPGIGVLTRELAKRTKKTVAIELDTRLLPVLAETLVGDVQNYEVFMEALRRSSPVPILFEPMDAGMDGYFSLAEQNIHLREGMSKIQTVCAAVHEITHAKLHNSDAEEQKSHRVEEIEALCPQFQNAYDYQNTT